MTVHIDERICKGCGLCVYYCPQEVLAISKRRNAKGYNVAEVVAAEDCVACRLCEMACPDLAIFVAEHDPEGANVGVECSAVQDSAT
jgi:2-oxoglutarate ferredoxin oxidoreductase subunit delta